MLIIIVNNSEIDTALFYKIIILIPIAVIVGFNVGWVINLHLS